MLNPLGTVVCSPQELPPRHHPASGRQRQTVIISRRNRHHVAQVAGRDRRAPLSCRPTPPPDRRPSAPDCAIGQSSLPPQSPPRCSIPGHIRLADTSSPHPTTRPSAVSARLWYIPAAIATTLLNPLGTVVWPDSLAPHATTSGAASTCQRRAGHSHGDDQWNPRKPLGADLFHGICFFSSLPGFVIGCWSLVTTCRPPHVVFTVVRPRLRTKGLYPYQRRTWADLSRLGDFSLAPFDTLGIAPTVTDTRPELRGRKRQRAAMAPSTRPAGKSAGPGKVPRPHTRIRADIQGHAPTHVGFRVQRLLRSWTRVLARGSSAERRRVGGSWRLWWTSRTSGPHQQASNSGATDRVRVSDACSLDGYHGRGRACGSATRRSYLTAVPVPPSSRRGTGYERPKAPAT